MRAIPRARQSRKFCCSSPLIPPKGPHRSQHTSRAKALPTPLSAWCGEIMTVQAASGCPDAVLPYGYSRRRAVARLEQYGLRFKFGRIGLQFANDALVIKGCGKLAAACGAVPECRRLLSRDIAHG